MVRLLCRACRYHASTSERGVNAEVERGVGGGDVLAGNVVSRGRRVKLLRMGVRESPEPDAPPTSLWSRAALARIADIRMTFTALCRP